MHQSSEKESAATAKMAVNQILIHNQNSKKENSVRIFICMTLF
jgi:hypothetical protein